MQQLWHRMAVPARITDSTQHVLSHCMPDRGRVWRAGASRDQGRQTVEEERQQWERERQRLEGEKVALRAHYEEQLLEVYKQADSKTHTALQQLQHEVCVAGGRKE